MPLYDYKCPTCYWKGERNPKIKDRDFQDCLVCNARLTRLVSAPMGRIAGRPVQGGGPDRFTADMLGVPLKELPSGLRTQ